MIFILVVSLFHGYCYLIFLFLICYDFIHLKKNFFLLKWRDKMLKYKIYLNTHHTLTFKLNFKIEQAKRTNFEVNRNFPKQIFFF